MSWLEDIFFLRMEREERKMNQVPTLSLAVGSQLLNKLLNPAPGHSWFLLVVTGTDTQKGRRLSKMLHHCLPLFRCMQLAPNSKNGSGPLL